MIVTYQRTYFPADPFKVNRSLLSACVVVVAAYLLVFSVSDAEMVHPPLPLESGFDFGLSIARLGIGDWIALSGLSLRCTDIRLATTLVECTSGVIAARADGDLQLQGTFTAVHDLSTRESVLHLDIVDPLGGQVDVQLHLRSQDWRLQISATGLRAALVKALAGEHGSQSIVDEQGTLTLSLKAAGDAGGMHMASGNLGFDAVAFDGTHVAEELSGIIEFTANDVDRDWLLEIDAALTAGIVYFEPGLEFRGTTPGFMLEVTSDALEAQALARWSSDSGRIIVSRSHVIHPGVGRFNGKFDLRYKPLALHSADLQLEAIDLDGLYTTYLQPLLIGSAAGRMEIVGLVNGNLRWREEGIDELALEFDDVHIDDVDERFSLSALNGRFGLTSGAQAVRSELAWEGASVYRIDLGSGKVGFSSQDAQVELTDWTDVAVLDGALRIETFSVEGLANLQPALSIGGELTPISLPTLTQALAWPLLNGKISGAIPHLSYRDGSLELTGDLNVGVFDGKITIRNLKIDDLFGLIPRLYLDVDVADLDLEQLTGTFSFGRISGRLGGHIHRLELDSWKPVYFEAEFATPDDDDTTHRISQQAVNNLGILGGGGAALSGGLLRFFRDYSYDRLGISCRLYNGFCELGGVAETDEGFYILTAGGMRPPWINVKGTGRSVEWRTLTAGLRRIARGEVVFD